jgi:uncharacterized protein YkwD
LTYFCQAQFNMSMDAIINKSIIIALACCIIIITACPAFAAGLTPFEKETLTYINKFRSEYGLAPLVFNTRLQALAREHSEWMCRNRLMGHQNADERYQKSGRRTCGENAGWNSRTPYEQFAGWRDSEGHRENMLDRNFRYAGVSKVGAYVTFFACD